MDPVAFPDIEAALVAWLPSALLPYGINQPVSTRIPNPRPDRFVRIHRTGGPQTSVVTDGAQVTVECWDISDVQAAATSRVLRAVLTSARNIATPTGALIYDVNEFSGPGLLPDPSGQPRYTWTVQIVTRGIPLTI